MSEPIEFHREQAARARARTFGQNGDADQDDRLVQIELDIRELKAEQRHLASKEDVHEAETRLGQALQDVKTAVATLMERTDAIKEHYATKWFILTSLIAVAGLTVAALKLLE